MAVVSDAELLELYAESRSELFPALRRESSLKPLVILLAVLPPLFALVNDGIDSADAQWGVHCLELLSFPESEAGEAGEESAADGSARLRPLTAGLTALALRIPTLSPPVGLMLVSFVSAVGVVLLWHALCRVLGRARFAFWSVLLLACHGPFLILVQSASANLLTLLLALGGLWGLLLHLRDAESLVSGKLLAGGLALGLCLLTGELAALAVVAVGALLAMAIRFDVAPLSRQNRESRSQLRGSWSALQSVALLAATAFAFGGWWLLMMASQHGFDFWEAWLGFGQAEAAVDSADAAQPIVERIVLRLYDLLGVLLVPALWGAWRLIRELVRPGGQSQRIPVLFLSAWLVVAAVIWVGSFIAHARPAPVWDSFILLPLVGCAAWGIEEFASRRARPIAALVVICLSVSTPYWSAVLIGGAWTVALALLFVVAVASLATWLLTGARDDRRQRVALAGLLLLLCAANALQGFSSVRLNDEERRQKKTLAKFHRSLLETERIDGQILITDFAAPPDVEFVMRTSRPDLSLDLTDDWTAGIARAAERISKTNRRVLIVDWRSAGGRTAGFHEPGRHVETRFPPTIFHNRRLTAYLLARRISPP